MKKMIRIKDSLFIAVISFLFSGCFINTSGAKKSAQAYLDTHYSNLQLNIVYMFNVSNESRIDRNQFYFLAVDKAGNEVIGDWNTKTHKMSDIANAYATVISNKKEADRLKQLLPSEIQADIYYKIKPAKESLDNQARSEIDIFCFNEINISNVDSLTNIFQKAILEFVPQTGLQYYYASIIFIYKSHPVKKKPYDKWELFDFRASNWEHYDGFLEIDIRNKPDKTGVIPIRLTGSSFLIREFGKDVQSQLANIYKSDKKSSVIKGAGVNNPADIFIDSEPRFFLIDRNNLEEIFFLSNIKDHKNNNKTILFVTGFYNPDTKQITNMEEHTPPATGERITNKELEYLIPESCNPGEWWK